ncbi:Uncharacterised protein [Mycobacteroides abscessus subsp. abscessus]|nr:Uncharacterised protein [Mycobacteroides abscessus subsp. abscessus]
MESRERIVGPFRAVVGRHHVKVPVENQRLPSATATQHTDHIVASRNLAEQLGLCSALPIYPGQQAGDIGLPAHQIVVVLTGIGRVHAAYRDGLGQCGDQLIAQAVDAGQHLRCVAHASAVSGCTAGDANSPLS